MTPHFIFIFLSGSKFNAEGWLDSLLFFYLFFFFFFNVCLNVNDRRKRLGGTSVHNLYICKTSSFTHRFLSMKRSRIFTSFVSFLLLTFIHISGPYSILVDTRHLHRNHSSKHCAIQTSKQGPSRVETPLALCSRLSKGLSSLSEPYTICSFGSHTVSAPPCIPLLRQWNHFHLHQLITRCAR